MTLSVDNRSVFDKRGVFWSASYALLLVSAVGGFGLVAAGVWIKSRFLVSCGLWAASPSALLAVVVSLFTLGVMIFRVYQGIFGGYGFRPTDAVSKADVERTGDVLIEAEELAGVRYKPEVDPVVLSKSPVKAKLIKYFGNPLENGPRWIGDLTKLQSVPAEHRVKAEFLNKKCFLLGLPHSSESWKFNSEWFFINVPEMVKGSFLKYLVLDLGRMDDTARNRVISFMVYLATGAENNISELRLSNVRADMLAELERREVKIERVDPAWVRGQRSEAIAVLD